MRAALAELNLPKDSENHIEYGKDIVIDDDDGPLDITSVDDLWDLISDVSEEPITSDEQHDPQEYVKNEGPRSRYDHAWLEQCCEHVAAKSGGLEAKALHDQVTAILASDSSDDELQMMLADMLGYDELDLVAEIIGHRQEMLQAPSQSGTAQSNGVTGRLLSRQEREDALHRADLEHKNKSLSAAVDRTGTQYPHVYRSHEAGNTLSAHGTKYTLPIGSQRNEYQHYEEHTIPAARVGTLGAGQKLVEIKELDGLCQRTFKGYKALNRMQSLVYHVAYKTSENMLICAPTGAGKTDAAMLTILNTIAKNVIPNPIDEPDATDFVLQADDFKIVYVAPMKALAAEVTEKLGKRLAWLGVNVRELTGDMHLTKSEIVATQIIVTTPEKWDVVTRKSTGDTELVQKVRLLIIDEVHMLHDERGAVLESLVARTERQVESTQSLIRIVGLSATLPNYIDVSVRSTAWQVSSTSTPLFDLCLLNSILSVSKASQAPNHRTRILRKQHSRKSATC